MIHISMATPLFGTKRELICLQRNSCAFNLANFIGLAGHMGYIVAFSLYFSLPYLIRCEKYGNGIVTVTLILLSISVILILIALVIKYVVFIPKIWSIPLRDDDDDYEDA